MRHFFAYLGERCWVLLLAGLCAGVFALVLALYDLPVEAVGYASLLCGTLLVLWGAVDWARWRRRTALLESLRGEVHLLLGYLPESRGLQETLYQELLRELLEDRRTAVSEADRRQREALDYYTLWIHQIKTPIAAMGLLLEDTDRDRELRAELFRVEQYAQLALSYLRLGSESTDYVIREVAVADVVRQAARKYAQLFIRGRVSLEVEEMDLRVLTDEKWLQLVVEQALSNAVKYAPGGHVRVYAREGDWLIIEDDGVGIAPEDLPRIFEKGFTGGNGRLEKRSTGIGLHLCREICRRLGHTITAASEPGRGTRITIGLARARLEVE